MERRSESGIKRNARGVRKAVATADPKYVEWRRKCTPDQINWQDLDAERQAFVIQTQGLLVDPQDLRICSDSRPSWPYPRDRFEELFREWKTVILVEGQV
ncbi:MAG: hypothetical protein WC343_12975 [Bacilli bacterium]|jgi:hypothetical protein